MAVIHDNKNIPNLERLLELNTVKIWQMWVKTSKVAEKDKLMNLNCNTAQLKPLQEFFGYGFVLWAKAKGKSADAVKPHVFMVYTKHMDV